MAKEKKDSEDKGAAPSHAQEEKKSGSGSSASGGLLKSTPDTIVCCDTGEKMMVKEPLPEVMRRAIEYARTIRRPITD